jgi:hypothetical protein
MQYNVVGCFDLVRIYARKELKAIVREIDECESESSEEKVTMS